MDMLSHNLKLYTVFLRSIYCVGYAELCTTYYNAGICDCTLNFMFEFPCIIILYYIKNQLDATLAVLFISRCKNYSTCFGRFLRPSSGVLKTVVAATGAWHGSGWYISSKDVQGRLPLPYVQWRPTLDILTGYMRVVPKVMSNFFLQANWEQQTKESMVVDGTSCCVILEFLWRQ